MKIYLSPSRQPANTYAYGGTNEEREMNRLATALKQELERLQGVEVMIGSFNKSVIDATVRDKSGTLRPARVAEAESFGADLVLVLHSNAGASPSQNHRGAQVYITNEEKKRRDLGTLIVSNLNRITPWADKSSGVIIKAFTEAKHYEALGMMTQYIEVEFHDNVEPAKWIIENTQKIASNIAVSVKSYYNLTSRSSSTGTAPSGGGATGSKVIYRVRANGEQIGAYSIVDGAINQARSALVAGKTIEIIPVAVAPSLKSLDEIAREVIRGLWGNGAERVQKLESSGYNANEVNAKVNEILRG